MLFNFCTFNLQSKRNMNTVSKYLNDKAWARWTVLVLVCTLIFAAYMYEAAVAPLQSLLEATKGWTPEIYGTFSGGEFILNVMGFLIVAGIILDKFGLRYTGTIGGVLMTIGGLIQWYAVGDSFEGTTLQGWLDSWWVSFPGSAKLGTLGFMFFGCGIEMTGTTVQKTVAKWFKGKELALAMAIRFSMTRVGVFCAFSLSPAIAQRHGNLTAAPSLMTFVIFLMIGLAAFIVFDFFDAKLDRQKGNDPDAEHEEPFHARDILKVFSSKVFWVVALFCCFYFSSVLPFQRYVTQMLQHNLDVTPGVAAGISRWFPMFAALMTPIFGTILDRKGRGATMLIIGSLIMLGCNLTFAFLQYFPYKVIAYFAICMLGVSFSLIGAALWPSVPKITSEKTLGSTFCLIYWIQNIGLCLFPMLIGGVLQAVNPGVSEAIAQGVEGARYNYTVPMLIFAACGVMTTIFSSRLRRMDRKYNYGIEKPNIK